MFLDDVHLSANLDHLEPASTAGEVKSLNSRFERAFIGDGREGVGFGKVLRFTGPAYKFLRASVDVEKMSSQSAVYLRVLKSAILS